MAKLGSGWQFRRISTRLGAGFGVMLVLVVIMLVAATLQLGRIQAHNADNERHTGRLVLVQEWSALVRANLERAMMASRLDAVIGDDEALRGQMDGLQSQLNAEMSATGTATVELQKKMTAVSDEPTVAAMMTRVNDTRSRFVALRAQIRDDIQMGEGKERIDKELAPLATSMLKGLDELTGHLKSASAQATSELAQNVQQARLMLTLICAVALAAGAFIAWQTTRAITGPMRDAVDIADRIAQGDLTHEIESQREDEIGSMLRRLSLMQNRLREAFSEISQAAERIGQASNEVASGTADLAHRTEQAASSLQATASSMEELTGVVQQSAESARAANNLATSSTQVAERGGQAVAQVVSTMDEINRSSSQIANIITVIDGIAFQTNILALNAAVEAARAGEQGRGFAVVAGEVRNLAQRSASAAREIKDLIDASVGHVNAGTQIVHNAGGTMTEIVESVRRVTTMIADISTASAGQTEQIARTNSAVAELDQMTQQNAALVEESTAASESLKDQAQRLVGIVSRFRLS